LSDSVFIAKLIAAACETIVRHTDELTALDQAIGDGDHGANLKRGFRAIGEAAGEYSQLEFGAALRKAGMTLVMKVGGASGPLYGSALMDMGKAVTQRPSGNGQVAEMLKAGINAIRRRGMSGPGAKTMLDVLMPVQAAVAAGAGITEIRAVADQALEATRPMLATKGRAAFLGERSIGHLDPGARSTQLLVHAACDVVEGR
jgi:dihydroxyacetone kinase-like protein